MPTRRDVIRSAALLGGATLLRGGDSGLWAEADAPELPAWSPGVLELHHIDTGRGNATCVLGPDGTSLLIDAGEAHSAPETMSAARPDASTPAGAVVARYVQQQLRRVGRQQLDVALMTHLHGDHVGQPVAGSPASTRGDYRLTGAGFVAEQVPVGTWIDRGWPEYRYPVAPTDLSALNYMAMVRSLAAGKGASAATELQRARAGSAAQLALRHDGSAFPQFQARVLCANGVLWTGRGEDAAPQFPPLEGMRAADLPDENMCSVAVLLRYGRFAYYTGGDLHGDTRFGRLPWHDMETPVAERAGAVTVATANHHGYFESCGAPMIRALRLRVWVLPTWHVSHPALSTMAALTSTELYVGERSIYAVELAPAAQLVNERFKANLRSVSGHVVVRVEPGGEQYAVYVLDATTERARVLRKDGPFTA